MKPFSPDVIDALSTAARSVALEPALLLALVSVETNGSPFEPDGSPTILCEPAVFYKELPIALRAQALSAGVAATKWSRDGYRDQGTAVGRAARFARMIAIDANAAYRSVSMGLGQGMGFNCSLAGYGTAQEMYDAFRDIGAQARAIVAMLPALGVLEPLKSHDWVQAAVHYNGPGERHNRYDAKLADSYAHWEFALASGQTEPPHDGLGLWSPHGEPVAALQRELTALGFPIAADGRYGPKTAEAVSRFELRNGLPDTRGIATQATLNAIVNATPIPQGARDVVTARTLAPTSTIIQGAQKLKAGALGLVGLGGTAAVTPSLSTVNDTLDRVDQAKATVTRATQAVGGTDALMSVLTWAAAHPLPIAGGAMVALGCGAVVVAHTIEQARVADARSGATT